MQVASSINTQGGALPGASARMKYAQLSATTVSVNGVSLEATHRLESGGLSVVVRGFDSADPNGTRLHERLLLKPGEHKSSQFDARMASRKHISRLSASATDCRFPQMAPDVSKRPTTLS